MDGSAAAQLDSSLIPQPSFLSSRRFRPYLKYQNSGAEWIGEIPSHWSTKRLKNLVHFQGGGTPSKENLEYWSGNIPWVSPKDMKTRLILDTADKITVEAVEESATNLVKPGAVLLVIRSGILNHTIPVAIAGTTVALNQDLKALIPGSEISPKYLLYVIEGKQSSLLVEWRKEGATVESLEMGLIENSHFPLPPKFEQHAIAEFLDRETGKIEVLVAKKERLIKLLGEKRTALITHAVTKGLDPDVPMKDSGVEWLGEIPEHWEVARIKHLSRFVTSGSRGWAGYYSEDGSLFLRIGNLNEGTVDLNLNEIQHVTPPFGSEGERTRVQPGDLLVSITALIGAVGVVPTKLPEAYVNQHIALVRLWSEHANSRWLAYCILSRVGQTQFLAELYGGTKDGLGLEDIRSLIVLLPPAGEQQTIVEFLDHEAEQSDILILKIREGIDRLKEFRTALISAAVTGKIDVREEVA